MIQDSASASIDAEAAAGKIAFDRIGNGDTVLLISGFPQTRRSWNKLISLLSTKFLNFMATEAQMTRTGQCTSIFLSSGRFDFPQDFKSLTRIDAGIPGITLLNDTQLSDYKRKWNFMFQMLPDLPMHFMLR